MEIRYVSLEGTDGVEWEFLQERIPIPLENWLRHHLETELDLNYQPIVTSTEKIQNI